MCRMEPLVLSGAQQQRPVFAAFHKGGRRIHIGLQVGRIHSTLLMTHLLQPITGK